MRKLLTKGEVVSIVLRSALRYAECHTERMDRAKRKRMLYNGPSPGTFHLSMGDRMILRQIADAIVDAAPKDWYAHLGPSMWGADMLYLYYYPDYYWSIERYKHE